MHVLDSAWETLKREFESASHEKQLKTRRHVTGELNRLFRRFRHYENEEQWLSALRDGVALSAREFAVFTLSGDELRLRSQQGLSLTEPLMISAAAAGAFASAIQSREPLVVLRRPSEVGAALAALENTARAHIVPVMNGERVVALVFAADHAELDPDGLELVAGIASAVIERQSNRALHTHIAPLANKIDPEPSNESAVPPIVMPSWADLRESDRRLHARAQRFARVAVAKIQLDRPEASRAGLKQNNVYLFLQPEIDRARESYAKQFMTIPSMVDYLHLEVLRSLANDRELNLGADYPGHLV